LAAIIGGGRDCAIAADNERTLAAKAAISFFMGRLREDFAGGTFRRRIESEKSAGIIAPLKAATDGDH
jgi:hypothetical protein